MRGAVVTGDPESKGHAGDGARRLAELADPSDPRGPAGAATCALYFREGLPLHAIDEDASLAPRLRPIAPPDVVVALDHMTDEHECIHAANDAMLALLGAVAGGAPVPRELASAVGALAAAPPGRYGAPGHSRGDGAAAVARARAHRMIE